MMAIMRANYAGFPISPRNSAAAVAYLISKTNVAHVLVGRDQAMLDLANNSLEILRTQYPNAIVPDLSPIPLFEDLYLPPSEVCIQSEDVPFEHQDPDAIVFYFHSSGTTAFPKPVPNTYYRWAQWALTPWFGERDLTDQVFSLHGMPMYHGMGALQMCWTVRAFTISKNGTVCLTPLQASCGLVMAAFEPKSPAKVLIFIVVLMSLSLSLHRFRLPIASSKQLKTPIAT